MSAKLVRVVSLIVIAGLVGLLVGCGGSSSGSGQPRLTGLTVTPSSASLPKGNTQQLSVKGTYSNGSSKDVTAQVAWTVSPSTIAKVSSSGLLTSLAQGTATVTATMTTVSGHVTLTVQPAAITAIQVSPSSLSVPLGKGQQMSASATYTDGSSGDVTNSVNWSTTPTSIATVNSSGMLQSVTKGSFSVTATSGSITKSLNGSVGNPVIQSLQVLPTSAAIPKGTTQSFSANAIYSDGSKQDVTSSTSWQSTNTAVASVDNAGLASSSTQGGTQINATYQTFGATAALTVSAATITSIHVSPATASLAKGTNLQLAASAVLTDGSSQDVTNSVTWSSNQASVCTVNASALASAVNTGTCSATATSGAASGSATLTVTPATLSNITITPPNPSVNSGGSLQLKATGTFSDGSTQDMTSSLTYSSSKPAVAFVTSAGLLKGLAPGSATITASLGSVSTSFGVTVTAATLQTITIGTGTVTVTAGISTQLTAIGSFSDGSTQDLSATVTWSSSATAVAGVNASGKVTGLAVGSATITATLGSVSGTTSVTVTPATIVSISVNPLSVTIAAGQSQAFTATATLTDGTTLDVTASVHWSVANPLLANISNTLGTEGVLSALVPGSSTVSASLNGTTGSANLFVSAASLVSISVGPGGLSLALGVPAQLTAIGTYSDGSTQDISASVEWSSSNGQLLSVSATGLVTPIAIGTANVSASLSGQTGSVSVGVTAAVLNSISISSSLNSIALGLTQQLTAIGNYSDGTTQDITSIVHWNSSNTSVLTVSAGGLVLAVGGGSANVTAALGSVNKSVSLNVSAAILESINVTASQNSFALGFTLQLTATGTYSDNSTQDLTAAVTWNTNNPAIALVSAAGLMSGLSVGGITATATLQGVSGSLAVTVNAATLTSITVSPASVTLLHLLLTQQFTVIGHFSDGSTQTLSGGIHWSCSNGLLATVNSTGLLTALGLGNLNVTATYGSLTASAAVSIL
jgi:trimeric autotransporter adhesin